MKKKIISMAICFSMLALLIAGGTLAYFTDTDSVTNVITAGNIEILLHEDNGDDATAADYKLDADYREWAELQPFVPTNTIAKQVWIENTGSQPAYVRVHYGIPSAAMNSVDDDGDQIAKFNFNNDGTWSIMNADGTAYNTYLTTIHGVEYFVVVATYTDVLQAVSTLTPNLQPEDLITTNSLVSVHMYDTVECSDKYEDNGVNYIDYSRGNGSYAATNGKVPVLVAAEAGQQFSFDDPYEALDLQFGAPASDASYISPLSNLFDDAGNLLDSYNEK